MIWQQSLLIELTNQKSENISNSHIEAAPAALGRALQQVRTVAAEHLYVALGPAQPLAHGLAKVGGPVSYTHLTCRSALEKAVQDGLIRVNPAIGCKLPPKKAREMQLSLIHISVRWLRY